jgi:hypothetical protein
MASESSSVVVNGVRVVRQVRGRGRDLAREHSEAVLFEQGERYNPSLSQKEEPIHCWNDG